MAHEKIHMTAVFLGKTHVLPDVFDHIVSRSHDLTGAFRFDKLAFFPPGKSNLIVAIFKADNRDMTESLAKIKQELNDEFGYSIPAEMEFIPHFTLGKLNLTKDELSKLTRSNFLNKVEDEIISRDDLFFAIDENYPLYLCGGS